MRAFSLFVSAIVIVLGIPRLVNEYRAPRRAAMASPAVVVSAVAVAQKNESQPAINAPALPRVTSAVPVEKPVAVQRVPVSLRPIEAAAVPVSQVPAIPANGKELISAIQNELSRLGYYEGPSSGKWSRDVRFAVREFIRQTGGHIRNSRPSAELLMSLKAAVSVKPESKPDKEPALDPQPIRDAQFRPKESPLPPKESKESAATPEAASSDDYLPPWMTRSGSAAKPDISSAANDAPPPAVSSTAGQVQHKLHRREREWDAFAFSPRRWRGENRWSEF